MRMWATLRTITSTVFYRKRAERELEEELRGHIERRAEDLERAGVSREEAGRKARIEFGGVESAKEGIRDATWQTYIESLFRDFRYAVRSLRKDRGLALTAIFTLALGIGSTSAVFSVIYNGLLRPFPYKDAARLTTFYVHDLQDASLQEAGRGDRGGFTSAELLEIRQHSQAFEDVIGFMTEELSCATGESTIQLQAALVTPDTFQFLGVSPLLGRSIDAADAKSDAPPVFAMNYRVWQKQFNGDPKILGKSFVIGSVPRTLVGIMPLRFQINPEGSDIWIPVTPNPNDTDIPMNAAEPMHFWWPLGRLHAGVSQQAAFSDLNLIGQRLAKAYPKLYPPQFTIVAQPFVDVVVGNFRGMLYALAVAVGMLLLITCTNVTNLLLARATTRQREMAIRASIGASRGRLLSQLLMESVLLAVAGGAGGCVLADWGLKGILNVLPTGALPEEASIKMNSFVLLFAVGAAIFTGLLCGLLSARHGLRCDLNKALAGSGKNAGGNNRGGRLRNGLVIAEVALSMVLLVGAGLMLRTLFALAKVDLGFNPVNLYITEISLPNGRYRMAEEKRLFYQQVLRDVSSLPSVIAAATTASTPPYGGPGSDIEISGRAHLGRWSVGIDLCSRDVFRTIGIGLLKGRLLSEGDIESGQRVVVINRTFARDYFGESDPVGQKVKFKVLDLIPDAPHDAEFEIVGVVNDIKNQGMREPVGPEAYLPYTIFGTPGGNVLIRTATGSPLMVKQLRDAIWSVDPSVSLADTVPLEIYLQRYDYAAPEFGLTTLGAFAGIGLVLVAIGIFGGMSYTVSLRTNEIGIRMALGARRYGILKMILSDGTSLVAAGVVIGLIASYGLTRFLANQIWGIPATDPWTFAAGASICGLAGIAACLFPALKASGGDPMIALRNE